MEEEKQVEIVRGKMMGLRIGKRFYKRRVNKKGIEWNTFLHHEFSLAYAKCIRNGIRACPTNIRDYMIKSIVENNTPISVDVARITREVISSHLQKYRKSKSVLLGIDKETYDSFKEALERKQDTGGCMLDGCMTVEEMIEIQKRKKDEMESVEYNLFLALYGEQMLNSYSSLNLVEIP